MKFRLFAALTVSMALAQAAAAADLVLTDDSGREVRLKAPARRIVALAPHIAESLYAVGAGGQLVGTVDYSDYPPEAKMVARVGGYSRVDLEAVAALTPDLVLAWESGNNMTQVNKLKGLGLTVCAFDVAALTKREEQLIVDQNRIANNRSADGTALDFPREIRTSSGILIRANPDKTTTVLGRFFMDTESIIRRQLDAPVGIVDTGPPRPGSFNLLNVPDEAVKRLRDERFWNEVNLPFLRAAIDRGDDIVLATRPTKDVLTDRVTKQITAFGREYNYLRSLGFRYIPETGKMVLGM